MSCNITVYIMWHDCHLCQYHIWMTISSIVPLHFLGQEVWNEVQHDFFDHVMPLELALASHNAQLHHQLHLCIPQVKAIKMRCHMAFMVMWYHLHQCQHHMMPTATPLVPLPSLGQDYQNVVQHDFLVMWGHWCQHPHHMMLMMLWTAWLYSLGQDDQNEVQMFCLVTSYALASASCHFDNVINDGTIAFLRSKLSKLES